jgi:hypothetical protein
VFQKIRSVAGVAAICNARPAFAVEACSVVADRKIRSKPGGARDASAGDDILEFINWYAGLLFA